MTLIDNQGFAANEWVRLDAEASAEHTADKTIWPLARLDEALSSDAEAIGIHLPNTARPADVLHGLDKLALISIQFPSFSDGRGFSLAKALRNAGYRGELRAFGPLVADQYAHAIGCGFDSIEVPDDLAARQPETHWQAALNSLSLAYQRGYERGINILDQRRKSRENLQFAQTGAA